MSDQVLDVVATLQARPGQGDRLAEIVTAALSTVRAEEGCLRYDFYRVKREDDSFVMVERYASKDALKAHGSSEHFAAMSAALADVLAEPPVVRILDPVGPEGAVP